MVWEKVIVIRKCCCKGNGCINASLLIQYYCIKARIHAFVLKLNGKISCCITGRFTLCVRWKWFLFSKRNLMPKEMLAMELLIFRLEPIKFDIGIKKIELVGQVDHAVIIWRWFVRVHVRLYMNIRCVMHQSQQSQRREKYTHTKRCKANKCAAYSLWKQYNYLLSL